jgi:hypothetical protein
MAGPKTRTSRGSVQPVLKANASVPWVDRVLNPEKYPKPVANAMGEIATHKMAAEYGPDGPNGPAYVFPTVVLEGGKYVELPLNQAMERALRVGDYIQTNKIEDAIKITERYKTKKFTDYLRGKSAGMKALTDAGR